MNPATPPYLFIYFISLLISIGIGAITWRRREITGARTYAVLTFGQASITLGYILELTSPTLEGKLFWDDFQWLGLLVWCVLFPIFALQYSRSALRHRTRIWVLLTLIPLTFFLLLVSNSLHGWIHQDAWLETGENFAVLLYEFTPLVWAFALYGYGMVLLAVVILLNEFFRTYSIYRFQIGTVVVGVGIPVLGTLLTLLGVTFNHQRDIMPVTLAIGNLIVGWGLLRFHLFDIVPIARDLVVEHLDDYVFVLDTKNRIIDLNLTARLRFSNGNETLIGRPALDVLSPWSEGVLALENFMEGETEISVDGEGNPAHFDVRVTTLRDRNKQISGRLVVARNITRQKELEQALRELNAGLETRVQNRTRQLAQAYDDTLEGWARTLELWDKETEGHARRAVEMTLKLARAVGVDEADIPNIRRGALLHDIGKMGVPNEILNKPGKLTEAEWEIMKQHPSIGYGLLAHISFLANALSIVHCHHEHWDGSGYPSGLKGDEIPLPARVFTLVDIWDALLSDRPYRDAWDEEQALSYIQEMSGTIFDPKIVDVFMNVCVRVRVEQPLA